jgi:hypothetical protein
MIRGPRTLNAGGKLMRIYEKKKEIGELVMGTAKY